MLSAISKLFASCLRLPILSGARRFGQVSRTPLVDLRILCHSRQKTRLKSFRTKYKAGLDKISANDIDCISRVKSIWVAKRSKLNLAGQNRYIYAATPFLLKKRVGRWVTCCYLRKTATSSFVQTSSYFLNCFRKYIDSTAKLSLDRFTSQIDIFTPQQLLVALIE